MATTHKGQIIRASKGAEGIGQWLNSNLDQLALVSGGPIQARRFGRVFMTEVQRVPGLLQCTPHSLVSGFLQASACGLEIGSHLRQAWLIPFRNRGRHEATLIFGYAGLVTLAMRSGIVVDVTAEAVREGDHFEYSLGTDPTVRHQKSVRSGMADAPITHAYAVAWSRGASRPKVKIMTADEIEKVKRSSRAAGKPDSPWNKYYDQMASKTALRRICKELPMLAETRALHAAVSVDEQADANLVQTFDVQSEALSESLEASFDPSTGELSPEEERAMEMLDKEGET